VKHVHEIELALEPDNRSTDHAATALRFRLLTDQCAGEASLPLLEVELELGLPEDVYLRRRD
jgi:hypothetical protein